MTQAEVGNLVVIVSFILMLGIAITFGIMFWKVHKLRREEEAEEAANPKAPPCPECHGDGTVERTISDEDERLYDVRVKCPTCSDGAKWYPGNDGVASVEDMWKFYLARGDEIVKLKEELSLKTADAQHEQACRIKAEEVRDEIQHVLDLQWNADMRAIKLWQEANPGNDHVWPDRGKLMLWLLTQIDELKKEIR